MWKQYLLPNSVESALQNMIDPKGSLAIIAGGTDLLIDLRQGRHSTVDKLIDITNIPEMSEICLSNSRIFIGAAVSLADLIQNNLLNENAHCLIESCGLIGGPQVRNVATIGGNVAHALPAGDGIISLITLNAEVEIASINGRRWQSLEEIFVSPGEISLNRDREIIVGFRIPIRKSGEGSAFKRVMRPQGVAIAILNMAIWIRIEEKQLIQNIRISIGPAGPRPFRARQTESFIIGKQLSEIDFQQVAGVLEKEVKIRTSPHRATAEYRDHLLPILFQQVYESAINQSHRILRENT